MDTGQDRIAVRLDTGARLIETSPQTLLKWIQQGRVPAVKVGRGWRIRVRDLEALMAPPDATERVP
jgi:excisionase family DNA binding protein